jgi:predicted AlkP superfamily pyrophosphatase or phosphodiesterase
MFIDALGWEVIRDRGFLEDIFPYRNPVEMQFGYSCTAIPTILTGQPPTVHKHLSFYYYDPIHSPFKMFKYLRFLPPKIFDRWRVRHILSKIIAKYNGYTGYFELYSMPYHKIQYFDYIEKRDLFIPNGLTPVKNLADYLVEKKIPHHISNWRLSEENNIDALLNEIKKEDIRFAFLYTAAMDSLLHRVTKDGKEILPKLEWYADKIKKTISEVKKHYQDFDFVIFSDHGMTTLTEAVDAQKILENNAYQLGKDYLTVYDSTMIHLWIINPAAKLELLSLIKEIPHSHLLSDEELEKYHVLFSDKMYGDFLVLMDPGYQIAPSDMGLKALPGMHGFAPEHPDSDASFLSMKPIENPPKWVGDYFNVMTKRKDKE